MRMFSGRGGSDGKDADASPGSAPQKAQKIENSHPNSMGDFPIHEDAKAFHDNNPDNNPILAAINRAASTQEAAHEATQNVIRERIDKLGEEVNERIDKLG